MSSDVLRQQLVGRAHDLIQSLANSIDNQGSLILRDDSMEFLSVTFHRIKAMLKGASSQEKNGRLGSAMARLQQLLLSVKSLSVFSTASTVQLRHFSLYPFNATDVAAKKSGSATSSALKQLQLDMCPPSTVRHLYEQRGSLESLIIMNSGITELIPVLAPVKSSVLRKLSPLIFPDALYSLPPQMVWSQLRVLKLSNCGIAKIDGALHFFPHIHHLDLSHNSIVHIVHLQDCVALRILNLSFNRIRVLSNLERVVGSITHLDVSYNEIQSLDGIDKVYSLESLHVERNFIDDYAEMFHLCRLPCLEDVRFNGNPLADQEEHRLYIFREFIKDGSVLRKGRSFPAIDGKHMSKREKQVLRRVMFQTTGALAEVDFSHAGDRYLRRDEHLLLNDEDESEEDFFDIAAVDSSDHEEIITGLDPTPDHEGYAPSAGFAGGDGPRSKSRSTSTNVAGNGSSVAARLSFTRSGGRTVSRSSSSSWRVVESRVQRNMETSPYIPRKLRMESERSNGTIRQKRQVLIASCTPPSISDDGVTSAGSAFPSLDAIEDALRLDREQQRTKCYSMMSNERAISDARQITNSHSKVSTVPLENGVPDATNVSDVSVSVGVAANGIPSEQGLGLSPPMREQQKSQDSSPLTPVESSTMDQLVRNIHDALLAPEEVEERISFMATAAEAEALVAEVDDDIASKIQNTQNQQKVEGVIDGEMNVDGEMQQREYTAEDISNDVEFKSRVSREENHAKPFSERPQQNSFENLAASGGRTLTLSESEHSQQSLFSAASNINNAGAMFRYVGDPDYRNLSVLENIELYFKEQVFGLQRPSGKHPYLKSKDVNEEANQYFRSPSGQSERFSALYCEKVIDVSPRKQFSFRSDITADVDYQSLRDKPRITPRKERKSLFRVNSDGENGKTKAKDGRIREDEKMEEEIQLYIAHTDRSVYFIHRGIDPKAMFCDAPLLTVVAAHPLYSLCKCIIFFGFQRTIFGFADEQSYLHLTNGSVSPVSGKNGNGVNGRVHTGALFSEQIVHQYVIITRDKSRLYPIISNIPKSANSRRAELHAATVANVKIENKDQQLVENILEYTSSLGSDHDIVHYQMAYQTWRTQPGVKLPRTVVLTQSMVLLCEEKLDSVEVRLEIVDTADLSDIYKILSEDNPLYVTFIIKPTRKMLIANKRKWRLCTDSRSASARLQDICRRTCAEKGNPDV